MGRRRDLIERRADDSEDLYDVSTWEPRSTLDKFALGAYRGLRFGTRGFVIFVALLITLVLLAPPAVIVAEDPVVAVFFVLSIVPAALLAGYIWYADITTREPLGLLVVTFVLAALFATFAAIINTLLRPQFDVFPVVGGILFFFLVVGPVEETVKLLAVRVSAYRSQSFDAVINGAVYGAVAGLGFAAIENALYIARTIATIDAEVGLLTAAAGITTVRALVGPGHVIYSAIAGYYLGLAKFNPDHAGPLVVKGLLIAAVVHATYNSTVQVAPEMIATTAPIGTDFAFVGYVIAFDVAIGYYLYRKIVRYNRTYRAVHDETAAHRRPELTEFDPPSR